MCLPSRKYAHLFCFVEVDPLIADVEAVPQWMEWLGQSTTPNLNPLR